LGAGPIVSGKRVAVVVQARTNSSRLPGKVLEPLAGAPAILRMMERVARVKRADSIVVATSDQPSDDALVGVCRANDIPVSRGPLNDVLARIVKAVPADAGVVVRLTGDCPLVDPALVDYHIDVFMREQPWAEYVTNAVVRTQPDGLDIEVVSRELLVRADRYAVAEYDREHVLPWVRRRARLVPVTQETDLSALRWTLDTPADYRAIAAIYEHLYPERPQFSSDDVYNLLVRHPELIHLADDDSRTAEESAAWIARIRAHLARDKAHR
jgi:spore coat polysaccharide biosynthesis protein SpsF